LCLTPTTTSAPSVGSLCMTKAERFPFRQEVHHSFLIWYSGSHLCILPLDEQRTSLTWQAVLSAVHAHCPQDFRQGECYLIYATLLSPVFRPSWTSHHWSHAQLVSQFISSSLTAETYL
jgi:hypothetical protein